MSSMRVRFCCAASSFSSAARRRDLYLVIAGGFLDELPPVGRPRAQDHADLARLDDRLELRDPRGRHRLTFPHLAQPCARALDRRGELAVASGEEHLLPAAQLVAQALIPARLRGLALQRAALLLHLEHDVVDAREVLLGGIELQLGGPAARLVLGDPGGFLDQLPAVGGTRAEDQPDLALLDDRVGLRAEAGVHQELVDVLQPADLAVDQVLALARSIQPPDHLDLAIRDRGVTVAVRRAVHGRVPVAVDVLEPVRLVRAIRCGSTRARTRHPSAAASLPRSRWACAHRCR